MVHRSRFPMMFACAIALTAVVSGPFMGSSVYGPPGSDLALAPTDTAIALVIPDASPAAAEPTALAPLAPAADLEGTTGRFIFDGPREPVQVVQVAAFRPSYGRFPANPTTGDSR